MLEYGAEGHESQDVDLETESEMLGDDLFPRDFIYALEAPTNYIGATSVFPKQELKMTDYEIVSCVLMVLSIF